MDGCLLARWVMIAVFRTSTLREEPVTPVVYPPRNWFLYQGTLILRHGAIESGDNLIEPFDVNAALTPCLAD